MREIRFWKEPPFIERSRKGLPQAPADLAEALLAFAVAGVMVGRAWPLGETRSKTNFIELEASHSYGYETYKRTLPALGGRADYQIDGILGECLWDSEDDRVPLKAFEYPSESIRSRAAAHHLFLLSGARPTNQDNFELEIEDLNEAFNRAAEILSSRRRAEAGAFAPYISRVAQAEESINKAESERMVKEAFQNRQAMSALMANGWLGLHVIHELATEALSFSQLVDRINEEADIVAASVTQLASGDLIEAQENRLRCTMKGINTITNLEAAASSYGETVDSDLRDMQ
jgi:hypothetical protein